MVRVSILHQGDRKPITSAWMEAEEAQADLATIHDAMENGALVKLPWFVGEAHEITSASLDKMRQMPAPALGRGFGHRRTAG